MIALICLPIVTAAGVHNVSLTLLPPPDVVTLYQPANNTVFTNINYSFFSWNATNLYNSTNITYRLYIDNNLAYTTNETNTTLTDFNPISTHTWYIIAEYDNSTAFSETRTFRFTQDFYDQTGIYCRDNPTASICQTVGGAGAGLGMFILNMMNPLFKLLVLIIFVAIVYIIGHALADRIEEL